MRLDPVKPLYDADGPYVTVHLDVSRDTEDARQQLDARWTTTRHDLEHAGVAPDLIEEIGSRLHETVHVPGEVRRTMVAAGGELVFDELTPGHTVLPETVTTGPLPDLAGWMSLADAGTTYLLVLVDRAGADLQLFAGHERRPLREVSVEGTTENITKVPEGGWAQQEYQSRTEQQWRDNARDVAEAVRSLCREAAPRVVLLAGDVRARTLLAEDLHGIHPDVVQLDTGGRAAGTSEEALEQEVRRVLAVYEAHDEQDVAETLDRGRATGKGVATGLDAVLDALVRAEVDRLVLDLQAAHELTVRPADHPGLTLPGSAATATELPADQVLVAAAAATGAEVVVLPRELAHGGGVSATLRF